MSTSKLQKQEIRNKEFCKKYLTPDWDGCAANDYFTNKVDLNISEKYFNKPKIEIFENLLELGIAENDFYISLDSLAYVKDEITSYLTELIADKINVPHSIKDKPTYIKTFLLIAEQVLDNIKEQKYNFQKTNF